VILWIQIHVGVLCEVNRMSLWRPRPTARPLPVTQFHRLNYMTEFHEIRYSSSLQKFVDEARFVKIGSVTVIICLSAWVNSCSVFHIPANICARFGTEYLPVTVSFMKRMERCNILAARTPSYSPRMHHLQPCHLFYRHTNDSVISAYLFCAHSGGKAPWLHTLSTHRIEGDNC
jgi:hypothetical protein